jgi:hypothetical protein
LSVLGAVALVFAFAYQAAAQPRPDALPPVVAAGLPAAYQPAALHHAPSQLTRLYTVRHGDTLSRIAAARCGVAADWTGIFAASRAAYRTGADPNLIYPGQLLVLSCRQATIPRQARTVTRAYVTGHPRYASSGHIDARGRIWGVSYGYPNYCGDGDGDGWDVACGTRHPASRGGSGYRGYSRPAGGTYHGSGSMQQCIIAAESGGSSQIMNSTGHYGLYQFSASTWAGSGGNPADFGHASVAEQNQVYYNAVAARGYRDWVPYDHC